MHLDDYRKDAGYSAFSCITATMIISAYLSVLTGYAVGQSCKNLSVSQQRGARATSEQFTIVQQCKI